ncbi:MAG: hypothetical protein JST30_15250 [Armatimonadetes bacterium]|nr:hypothetical protein [Armatimonadota bacterium]
MSQPDTPAGLARRLHVLTSLLAESEPDAEETGATLVERQQVLDRLASLELDPEARRWIEDSKELEESLVQRWELGLKSMQGQMHASRQTKRAISAYKRHEAAR